MPVIMFKGRFASRVADGTKPHTIRPKRKRQVKVGQRLSLRKWSDQPYRSPQVKLREAPCVRVVDFRLDVNHRSRPVVGSDIGDPECYLDGKKLSPRECIALALADGFENWSDFVAFFSIVHGLPFHGELIQWEVVA